MVAEDMPACVVVLEDVHESEGGLVGDAWPALRVKDRRRARRDRDVEGGHGGRHLEIKLILRRPQEPQEAV